jgi:uncharacterized ion transporter superfamily protein YfcC
MTCPILGLTCILTKKLLVKRFKIPHIFIFLFWIIVSCSLLTYIIPSGSFEREQKDYGEITQTVIVPDSYSEIPKNYSLQAALLEESVEGKSSPVSVLGTLSAIPKGLADSAVLVFYLFIIGSVFTVVQHTGAINAFLFALIAKFKNKPKLLLFLVYMAVFSASSFMGILGESIALIPVFLFLSKSLGYDRMFGFALISVPLFLGWSSGVTNPFTVQIAQIIAELPIGSGIGFRFFIYLVYAGVGFYFIIRYGNRIKKNPSVSLMKDDEFNLTQFGSFEKEKLERRHSYILLFFVLSYAAILLAVQSIGWGLIEMTGCFIGMLIVIAIIARMSGDELMNAFTTGLKIMIVPALVVGIARGISVVLEEGMIIDTILYHSSEALLTIPKVFAAEGMLFFQTLLNFFIPSASGQALVSMPLMTPLSDILGISRQIAVLAYLLGDGLSNLIIPTNGILMAMIGMAGVSYQNWLKFIFSLFIFVMILALIFIAVAVFIGY